MLRQEFSWLFSSSPLLGAQNVSSDGSTFTAQLQEPFSLPKNAFNVTVECSQATIWWNTFNVTELTNQFQFERVLNPGLPLVTYIPPGLYTFDQLDQQLTGQLLALGITNYRLIADQPTQRVLEQFTPSANEIISVNWNERSFRKLLGFDNKTTVFANVTPETFRGENVARFNSTDYYLIHSSLVPRGIRLNGVFNQLLAQVPINAPPGSELLYQPQNPVATPANELIGNVLSQITFILTDSSNVPVNTQGESWTVTAVIRWIVPTY